MIAEVYPLKRMPRKFGVFDYLIPEGVELSRGDCVEIPFRNRTIHGIVARVKDKGPRGIQLKELSASEHGIHLRDEELAFYEALAEDLAQSAPSVLHVAIPTPPKRGTTKRTYWTPISLTILSSEAPNIALMVKHMLTRGSSFLQLSDLRRMAATISGFLHEHPEQLTMILTPNVRDAELLAKALGDRDPLVLTGGESNNARHALWKEWQSRKHGILIGTRVAALVANAAVTHVIVVRSSHENHKQSDRNPRFDTRQITHMMEERFHSTTHFLDVAPRVDDVARFEVEQIFSTQLHTPMEVVDLNKERTTAPHPLLGYTASNAIEQTLSEHKSVICVYNKKGLSRQLRCQDCGHHFPCPSCGGVFAVYETTIRCHRCGTTEPHPISCPKCRSKDLRQKGFGNRRLAKDLADLYTGARVNVIEKGGNDSLDADILIVTRHYYENLFNPFKPIGAGLVVELNGDFALYEPTLRAFEHAIINAEEWRGVAHANRARFILQTQAPGLFESYLDNPGNIYQEELEMRRRYEQPPAKRWIRLTHKSDEPRASEIEVQELMKRLKSKVEDLRVVGPKRTEEYQLQVDLGIPQSETRTILPILAALDDSFIIDTNLLF